MRSWFSKLAAATAGLLLATSAMAELPRGSLQFITPSATVGAHEAIPIWVRLTSDPVATPRFANACTPGCG